MSENNHEEAEHLAIATRETSNLARCYLDMKQRAEAAEAVAQMAAHDRDEALVNLDAACIQTANLMSDALAAVTAEFSAARAEATRLREALTSLVNAVEDAFESPVEASSWQRKRCMVPYIEKANAALAASRAGEAP